jgi:membrane protein
MATVTATPLTDSASRAQAARTWLGMLKQTASDWMEDKAMRLSAALALYTILSLAPILIIAIKIASTFLQDPNTKQKIVDNVAAQIGRNAGKAIGEMVTNTGKHGAGVVATVISVAILLFSASGVFGELQDSLNTIWEVKPKPNRPWLQVIKDRFLSLAMVFVIAFLLLVSLIVSTVLTAAADKIAGGAGWLSIVLDIVVSVGVSTLLFAAIFRFLPDVKIGWRDVMIGALVTAVLFKLGQYALALYFKYGAPTSAYGAFGSIMAVLLWAYYSSMILFFGAEFTQVYSRQHGRWVEPTDNAVKLTEKDRIQRGIPSQDVLAAKAIEQDAAAAAGRGTHLFDVVRRPVVVRQGGGDGRGTKGKDYAWAAGGAVLGAVLGGLGVEYLLHDPKKPSRRQTAAVRLNERLNRVEDKLGRVSRIKDYLEEMDVKERIDRVEKEVRRAGTHLRANETGRRTWMVKLGDLIGGRR